MTDRAATRQQLADMRSRLIGNLGKQIEGGDLALLAAVTGALAAIDAEAALLRALAIAQELIAAAGRRLR